MPMILLGQIGGGAVTGDKLQAAKPSKAKTPVISPMILIVGWSFSILSLSLNQTCWNPCNYWLAVSTPLKNMLVSWKYSSQYMESHKIHVPNHQPWEWIIPSHTSFQIENTHLLYPCIIPSFEYIHYMMMYNPIYIYIHTLYIYYISIPIVRIPLFPSPFLIGASGLVDPTVTIAFRCRRKVSTILATQTWRIQGDAPVT